MTHAYRTKTEKIVRHTVRPRLYPTADKANWGREQQVGGRFCYSTNRWPSKRSVNKTESETYTSSEIRESLEHKRWVKTITLKRTCPKRSVTRERARVRNPTAAALTHFKMGTSAGDWASDHLATTLGATPINYGIWADFKNKFKEQFIPPQTQVESIQKIHNLPMGNREFNEWYQDWSMHARRANVDKQTRMYAFRRNLNQSLHQKIVQMSP